MVNGGVLEVCVGGSTYWQRVLSIEFCKVSFGLSLKSMGAFLQLYTLRTVRTVADTLSGRQLRLLELFVE